MEECTWARIILTVFACASEEAEDATHVMLLALTFEGSLLRGIPQRDRRARRGKRATALFRLATT